MCKFDCQCIICEMEKQGVLQPEEEKKDEQPPTLFEEFVRSGLGS